MVRTLGKLLLVAALAAPLVACATNSSAGSSGSSSTPASTPSGASLAKPTPTPLSDASEDDRAVLEAVLGSWGDESGPHLIFTSDGAVSGSDGCNRIGGAFSADGDTIVLTRLASTLKACEGVDTWLNGVRQVRVDADQLIVLDRAAAEIGTLPRTA